jgi:hypothetical protein
MNRNFLFRTAKTVTTFIALMFLCFPQGCMYYYKVQTVNKVSQQDFKMYEYLNKYLILHQGASAWKLKNLKYDSEQFSGDLSVLTPNHLKYQTTNPKQANRYKNTKRNDESAVLQEVHLYVEDSLVPELNIGDNIKLHFSTIKRTEIYTAAKGRTTASWIVPIITPIVVIGGLITIAALTKSSCPLVYIKNGNDYAFAGEIFGGAVYSSLERHDYLPLPDYKPSKNQYSLIISNGLPEIQYINLAELWIVNHPVNVTVLPDRRGIVHSISKPQLPFEALSSANSDLLSFIINKDQRCFLFDEEPSKTGDTCAFNSVFLSFSVPDKADTGKFIVRAGNSIWGDYTYGEFTKLFGYNYSAWIKKQGKEPAEKNSRWKLDQRFALMVYLETKTGWQFVDYFDLIGPLGARDLIMPVALGEALITNSPESNRVIRIKLESGFKFWDLDYAAMDFSMDIKFRVDHVQPFSAITESGIDVTRSLTENDSLYYVQETTGEQGLVVYTDSPDLRGMKKSVFLHTKGYYEHVRNYQNPPDKKQLQTFLIPGRFSKFSYDNHAEFVKNNWVFASDPKLP